MLVNNTPFAADVGTELLLRICVKTEDDLIELPVEVVASNVDRDLTTRSLGMSVKFRCLSPEQRAFVRELLEAAAASDGK